MSEVRWNGEALIHELHEAVAQGLLRGAVFFQTTLRQRLNVSNPRPYLASSKPGEYPRARTGFGRNSVLYEPTTIEGIKAEQAVRIGWLANAWYMAFLERGRGRLGLERTLKDLQQQLASAIMGG